jgi:hypothetical protein
MLLSGTGRCLHNTQIQCGRNVQLLNVKVVDASRNQKVKHHTQGIKPTNYTQHSEHGESLKSRI